MKQLSVLVGCEESQEVCKAFRAKDHNAFSCDLKPCSGGHPEWHLQIDVTEAIDMQKWDMIILHPDCTAMAVSGNAHYGHGRPLQYKRAESITWTKWLWQKAISVCEHVGLENPVSVIFQHIKNGNSQYIQPYQFGHPESKKTGLYLHGLPKLKPTNILQLPDCGYWNNQTPSRQNKLGPSPDRKQIRSKTYTGIALAMADQWSEYLTKRK